MERDLEPHAPDIIAVPREVLEKMQEELRHTQERLAALELTLGKYLMNGAEVAVQTPDNTTPALPLPGPVSGIILATSAAAEADAPLEAHEARASLFETFEDTTNALLTAATYELRERAQAPEPTGRIKRILPGKAPQPAVISWEERTGRYSHQYSIDYTPDAEGNRLSSFKSYSRVDGYPQGFSVAVATHEASTRAKQIDISWHVADYRSGSIYNVVKADEGAEILKKMLPAEVSPEEAELMATLSEFDGQTIAPTDDGLDRYVSTRLFDDDHHMTFDFSLADAVQITHKIPCTYGNNMQTVSSYTYNTASQSFRRTSGNRENTLDEISSKEAEILLRLALKLVPGEKY